jgi:predicted nuclease with TOPRIM domain
MKEESATCSGVYGLSTDESMEYFRIKLRNSGDETQQLKEENSSLTSELMKLRVKVAEVEAEKAQINKVLNQQQVQLETQARDIETVEHNNNEFIEGLCVGK